VSTAVPRSLIVAVVIAAVVAAGALAGAAMLRWRATSSAGAATTSQNPPPGGAVTPSVCLVEPCQVLASTTVGGTTVELMADAGARSGRLRIGGPTSGQVIETTITEQGVILTTESLQCLPGTPAACLVRGRQGTGLTGQLVVGRSDRWSGLQTRFVSAAGYLALANVDGDLEPELLAAQHDCGDAGSEGCTDRPVFVQVFGIRGDVLGCTRSYPRVDRLPNYPTVQVSRSQLTQCG
jgi:hypothetical protein